MKRQRAESAALCFGKDGHGKEQGEKMARCPFCNAILDDEWIKHQGASLMGKEGGKAKIRSNAREASLTRWNKKRKYTKIEDTLEFSP